MRGSFGYLGLEAPVPVYRFLSCGFRRNAVSVGIVSVRLVESNFAQKLVYWLAYISAKLRFRAESLVITRYKREDYLKFHSNVHGH